MSAWAATAGVAGAAALERALRSGAVADALGSLRAPAACDLPLGCLVLLGAAATLLALALAYLLHRAAAKPAAVLIVDFAVFNPPARCVSGGLGRREKNSPLRAFAGVRRAARITFSSTVLHACCCMRPGSCQ